MSKNKESPERVQTTLRIPANLLEQLTQEAFQKGISINAYILTLIEKSRK